MIARIMHRDPLNPPPARHEWLWGIIGALVITWLVGSML